jgi:hypothetical protein
MYHVRKIVAVTANLGGISTYFQLTFFKMWGKLKIFNAIAIIRISTAVCSAIGRTREVKYDEQTKVWKRNVMEERTRSMYERVKGTENRGRGSFNFRRWNKEGTEGGREKWRKNRQ